VLDTAEEAITFYAENVKRKHNKNQFVSHAFSHIEQKKHNKMYYKCCSQFKKQEDHLLDQEYFQMLFLFFHGSLPFFYISFIVMYFLPHPHPFFFILLIHVNCRSQWPRGLRPLTCWECGLESHRGHGCLSVLIVVCCQVEVSATNRSLVHRSPTECGASLFVI
jgi:hypothetical protein